MDMNKPCFLVLEDGTAYAGEAFGTLPPLVEDLSLKHQIPFGEVVFNTGMSGYVEIATDPSYTGQMVVMTYPHIGNYGVDLKWAESMDGKPGLSAMIIRSLYKGPVPGERMPLDKYFSDNGISGITGVDTRSLTLKLRDGGSCNGVIVKSRGDSPVLSDEEKRKALSFLSTCPSMEGFNLVSETGTTEKARYNPEGSPHITVVDCGIKENIVLSLLERGCRVTVVPSTSTSSEITDTGCGGVLVSNGPGDPAVLTDIIDQVKNLAGKIPLSGICLGHQIIGLALGAKTVKMKFGHHGINHPVRNMEDAKVLITSQNHGFMIDEETLPEDVDVWMRNSNDNTIEGLKYKKLSIITTQFHPEAAPGPHDSLWIFDEIIKNAENK